jgi:hypothetical protein
LSRFVDESALDELEKEGFFKTLTRNVASKYLLDAIAMKAISRNSTMTIAFDWAK